MLRRLITAPAAFGVVTTFFFLSVVGAEITSRQQAQVAALKNAIDHAARLFKQEKFPESAAEVAKCQALLARSATGASAEFLAALAPAQARLQKAHTLFAAKGMELPALPELTAAAGGASAAASGARGDSIEAAGNSGEISFTKQVAPILVARCGMCHVGRNMGEFSMASFAALMRGSENGEMVVAGKPEESVLTELVAAGEMPPRRPRPRPVPRDEVQVLVDWVAQGAKFDGASEEDRLLDMVPPEIARGAAGRGGGPGGARGRGERRPGPGSVTRPAR